MDNLAILSKRFGKQLVCVFCGQFGERGIEEFLMVLNTQIILSNNSCLDLLQDYECMATLGSITSLCHSDFIDLLNLTLKFFRSGSS